MKSISIAFVTSGLALVEAQVQLYGQCGGLEYTGSTLCASGSSCVYQNDYYYQCLQANSSQVTSTSVTSAVSTGISTIVAVATTASSTTSALPLYAQCGGQDWTTSTTCVSGASCVYQNDYYSQCLPVTASSSSTLASSASTSSLTSVVAAVSSTTLSGSVTASSSVKSTTALSSVATSSSVKATTTSSATASSSVKSTTTSSSVAAASSSATSSASSSSLGFRGGVNTAGYDFSVYTDGSFSGTGVTPPSSQYAHFANQGANVFRIPFAWQLMTPTVGGTIDSTFFAEYDATVQAALASGDDVYVILDLHNYARWNGAVVGQGGPTNDEFASLWSQLATKYASNDRIIFGLMNEPHDLSSLSDWADSVQAAVTAIRQVGATSQYMLLPGSSYSSAGTLPTEAGPYLLDVTDPSGGSDKLLFDVHKYLDSDGSGTSTECVTDNVDVLTTLVAWLKTNSRQAFLSETGGGSTASCESYLKSELAYVKSNSDYIVGFTAWAAGAFDTTYALTITPNSDGSDQAIWTDAILPNLP
ncbi:glycoside hydrolase superfamily [Lentinula edodes]|uniref:cellulase n=1 Tax=Lentinula lateritia TaxID=40482 RepID=A0A9W9DD28_9AGAR|nr:glycoside hydrolase superfamily [Lentinula edodes]